MAANQREARGDKCMPIASARKEEPLETEVTGVAGLPARQYRAYLNSVVWLILSNIIQ